VSKKLIIITAAAGLISFAGAFIVGWLTKPSPPSRPDELSQPTLAGAEVELELLGPESGTMDTVVAPSGTMKKAMTERQLKSLVYEIREKVREYNNKLQTIELQGQRLQIARDELTKDIENLNNLQIELASTVAGLKEQRNKLLKTRVDITKEEKANLVSIAATYDKMDAQSASKILISLCTKQIKSADVGEVDSGLNDAIKILHYMTERTKAKVLAELVTSEPQLASLLCQKLKRVSEI